MGLLDKLLGRSRPAKSQLYGFLAAIDRSAIHARAREQRVPELRVAAAISLLVLEQSGRFTREISAAARDTPVTDAVADRISSSFDAAAFEVAAFLHYSIMAKHLGSSDDEIDYDEESDEDDPYFNAVRAAHRLTGGILDSLTSFKMGEQIFLNRLIAYSMLIARRKPLVEMFEGVLIEAIETGVPATLRATGISEDLGLSLAVGLKTRAFAITTLPAFVEVARNVVAPAAELGFE